MVVREHVGKLGLFARVILEVHLDLLAAKQQRGFESPVAARDEAGVCGHRDWSPQPLPSITAAMAATCAAEWVLGFFGCGFRSATRTS
jgi:hypothetical protein